MRIPKDFGARLLALLAETPGGLEQLAAIEQALGANLEVDLLSWLQGEALIAYFPGDARTAAPFALRVRVADPAAAEAGLGRLFAGLARANGMPDGPLPALLGADTYAVVETDEGRIGYRVSGGEVVIALGEPALSAMSEASSTLTDDAGYRAALSALPAANGGVVYLEIGELRALLEAAGGEPGVVAGRLASFQAVVAAGAPGTDPEGVARASLILTLADE